MQGFLGMLKAVGIDPDKLKADAEGFVKGIHERFVSVEARLAKLERSVFEDFTTEVHEDEGNILPGPEKEKE